MKFKLTCQWSEWITLEHIVDHFFLFIEYFRVKKIRDGDDEKKRSKEREEKKKKKEREGERERDQRKKKKC